MDPDLLNKIKDNDLTITVNDARIIFKGCIPGWKTFAETHGFDWKQVLKHGLKASQLAATNDAMAEQILKVKYYEQ